MAGSLNQHVVTWARGKLGQKVGAGECWDLADGALRAAGASSSTTTGDDDDYVWGDSVIPAGALPGDIVQFRDYVATIDTTTDSTFADGSGSTDEAEDVFERPHHTGVIESVGPKGFVVLEQNVDPGGQKVQRHTLPFVSKTTITTVQKPMRTPSGGFRSAKVVVTVEVTVTGQLWVYRPQRATK
ncbi:MAG TPA: hypothetical protein VLT58_08995 [Polyangia bacterium]|nr:hypothetical protein [Polyangia bacterium]